MTQHRACGLLLVTAGLCAAALGIPVVAASQGAGQSANPTVRRAVSAYNDLDYTGAISAARMAMHDRLSASDQARVYETLGFAYAALDSAPKATEALKQLILLDPERDLDPTRISPKITSLYALALGQVLVIRHFHVDGAPFVAGTAGAVGFVFNVTRGARVRTRVTGPLGGVVIDSTMHDGPVRVGWNGLLEAGHPPPTGTYRLIVEAWAGRDSYAAAFPLRIDASPVDTVAHLTSLPGYTLLPEMVIPPRSLRPVAATAVAVAAVAAGTVALQPSSLNGGDRRALVGVSAGALVAGALATIKRPAPVPSEPNIRYNALVREQLARRNTDIAAENAVRRSQVRLTVTALSDLGPQVARTP